MPAEADRMDGEAAVYCDATPLYVAGTKSGAAVVCRYGTITCVFVGSAGGGCVR